MGKDAFEITVNIVKMFAIFLLMVQLVPILVWVERRGSGFLQNRLGPNRVGPLGLLQLLADAVKFLFKEEFLPQKAVAFMYYGAPVAALIPAALALASIPLSVPINLQPFETEWEGYVTLEFSNTTPLPAKIYAGEGCAQVLFFESDEVCEVSYKDRGGKYQGQRGVTLPKA